MKVEIELSELESIRAENHEARKKIQELEQKIDHLDGTVAKKEASEIARDYFRKIVAKSFRDLGFTAEWFGVEVPWQPNWWESENIEVVLGANINNAIKVAYLKIGIVAK